MIKTLTDKEFIIFLCYQLWNSIYHGNKPDLKIVKKELKYREINPDNIFYLLERDD